MGAIHVTPAIADKKTAGQIQRVIGRGAKYHSGLRFPAIARFAMAGAGVITDFDRIERRNGLAELPVHGLNQFAALGSAPDIRLVRNYHQDETRLLQLRAAVRNVGINLELLQRRRRKWKTVANDGTIQDAVAIEKDGGPAYFVLSHFVCAVFSAGCETSKCQTTAWNASVCGVVFIGLTVGMMMQTSATCAV